MPRILRRPAARHDVLAIWRYIARDSEAFADALVDRIDDRLALLAANPLAGRSRGELRPRLRSFTLGNYVLYYDALADGIVVVRVLHAARDAVAELLRDA